MVVYEFSLGDGATAPDAVTTKASERSETSEGERDAAVEGCRGILDRMVDPAVEMCMLASEEKQKLRPSWDREVFVINVMTYLQVRV